MYWRCLFIDKYINRVSPPCIDLKYSSNTHEAYEVAKYTMKKMLSPH